MKYGPAETRADISSVDGGYWTVWKPVYEALTEPHFNLRITGTMWRDSDQPISVKVDSARCTIVEVTV